MSELEKKINRLSSAEKILLVEKIWNSISGEYEPKLTTAQEKELDRRLKLIESGEAVFLSLDEIKARFKALK